MLDTAIKVLNIMISHGYKAYIVGGFVRDYIMKRNGDDIDIATNATPKEIMEMFDETVLPKEEYGSVTLYYKGYRFEITTFRREIRYIHNRKPVEIEYIDDLLEDLKRRDFRMNTLCIDKDRNIIDLLDGKKDIDNKIINTVGDANFKFEQDSLRIMRAIRFASILDFDLNNDVKDAIIKNKYSLKELSFERRKEELNKIFVSNNSSKGIELINELGLCEFLDISNLDVISKCSDILGIWSIIDSNDKYPFCKNERDIIKNIRIVVNSGIDNFSLYKYGLYVNQVASLILGIDKQSVTKMYESLPIKMRKEIDITSEDIKNNLNISGKLFRDIYNDLESKILLGEVENNKEKIIDFLKNKYL